ncbi:hypothetical protein BC829DRAFT_448822 [Chytridium lagenaria]|nr:hypothetical protein BC829DRAFT_448822 [Chytridium lagenaria]
MDDYLVARERRREDEERRWIEEGVGMHIDTLARGKEAEGGEASTTAEQDVDAFSIDDDAFDTALASLFEAGAPSQSDVRALVRRFKDKAVGKPMRFTFEDRPNIIRKRHRVLATTNQNDPDSDESITDGPQTASRRAHLSPQRDRSQMHESATGQTAQFVATSSSTLPPSGQAGAQVTAPDSNVLPVLTASGWILAPRTSVAPGVFAPNLSTMPIFGSVPPPPPTKALPKWTAAKAAIDNAFSLISVPRESMSARSGLMAPSAKATRHTIATLDIYTELRILQKKDILELVTSIDRVLAGYFSSEIWDAVAKLTPLHMVAFDAESGSKLTRRMIVDEGSLNWTEEVVDESKQFRDFASWSAAFKRFKSATLVFYPHRIAELKAFKMEILNVTTTYCWEAAASYEYAKRVFVLREPYMQLDDDAPVVFQRHVTNRFKASTSLQHIVSHIPNTSPVGTNDAAPISSPLQDFPLMNQPLQHSDNLEANPDGAIAIPCIPNLQRAVLPSATIVPSREKVCTIQAPFEIPFSVSQKRIAAFAADNPGFTFINTPISPSAFAYLTHNFPNQPLRNYLLRGLIRGFPIPAVLAPTISFTANHSSTTTFHPTAPQQIHDNIQKE